MTEEDQTQISAGQMKVRIFYVDPDGYEINIEGDAEARQLLKNFLNASYNAGQKLIPVDGEYEKTSVRHVVICEVLNTTTTSSKRQKLKNHREDVCPDDRIAYLTSSGKRMTDREYRHGANWMQKATFNDLVTKFKEEMLKKTLYGGRWKFNVPKAGKKKQLEEILLA